MAGFLSDGLSAARCSLVHAIASHAPDLVDELVDILEIAVHGGEPHIRDLVDLAQRLHRAVADLVGRHLAFVVGLQPARDLRHDHVDRLRLHVAFPAGFLDRDNKNASSTGKYWLLKVFEILKNYQDDIVLDGTIVFDETFFTVVESKRTYKDGNKLRGISRDKICIAVAYDGFRTIILSENVSKPSSKSTLNTLKGHIKPGSKLIHDDEHSHQVLVKELDLKEEFCKSSYQEFLTEEENPLTPINKIHSYMKKFMRNHEGFSRDNIQDWMNLISFIINDPENRYDKLKLFLKMAISTPKKVRFRDVMSKKG